MRRPLTLVSLGFVLLLALAGCARPPETRYYTLDRAGGPTAGGGANDGPRIGIEPFRVEPPYDQDRLVYRIGDDSPEVRFYHYHRWAAPLSRMLPRVVAASLAEIAAVEPRDPRMAYDALLGGRVLALEEIDGSAGPAVRIALELELRLPDGSRLWSDRLDATQSHATCEVAVLVEGIRSLLESSLREARPGLERGLRQIPPR